MSNEIDNSGDIENYYTLVPEQGLCLAGDDIINLKLVPLIRKLEGKTLVYTGAPEPVILPLKAFDQIRDAVFSMDDDLDDEEDYDEDDEA